MSTPLTILVLGLPVDMTTPDTIDPEKETLSSLSDKNLTELFPTLEPQKIHLWIKPINCSATQSLRDTPITQLRVYSMHRYMILPSDGAVLSIEQTNLMRYLLNVDGFGPVSVQYITSPQDICIVSWPKTARTLWRPTFSSWDQIATSSGSTKPAPKVRRDKKTTRRGRGRGRGGSGSKYNR